MKSDWEIKWKKKVYETKEFPGDWEWGLSKWGINGIEQFIRKQIQQARQEGIEVVKKILENMRLDIDIETKISELKKKPVTIKKEE